MFSKIDVLLLIDLQKERKQNQDCSQSLRSVLPSITKSGFVANGYTSCMKDYLKMRNVIYLRSELRNQSQRYFKFTSFGTEREC